MWHLVYCVLFFGTVPSSCLGFYMEFHLKYNPCIRYFPQIPIDIFKHSRQSKYLVISAGGPYASRRDKTYYGKGGISVDSCGLRVVCYWRRLPGEVLESPCSEFFKAQLAKAWCDTVLTTALTWRRDGTSWSPEVPANQNSYGSVTASCNPVYTFIKFFAPGGLWSDSVFEEEGIFLSLLLCQLNPVCVIQSGMYLYTCVLLRGIHCSPQ